MVAVVALCGSMGAFGCPDASCCAAPVLSLGVWLFLWPRCAAPGRDGLAGITRADWRALDVVASSSSPSSSQFVRKDEPLFARGRGRALCREGCALGYGGCSAVAWVHLVVLTRLAVRLPCFLWGFGCFCGPGVRRRVVAVLLESTRADWRALDVVVASSPSSSQWVRKDEPLIARGRGRAWCREGAALGCGGCSLR